LAGDLDSIVLKALAPDPRRRYPTVEQLVQDIDRYLDGQPVQARASTFLYRAGKFLRRNLWSVLFGLLLFVSLVSFALAMKALRDDATQSKIFANQVFLDLADVLPALDPDRQRSAGPDDVLRESLRDFVDIYAGRSTDHLEPRLRGDFKQTLGRIYVGLGEYREAEPLLGESVRLYEQIQGLPLEVLATAQTDFAFAQLKLDNRAGAERSLNQALENLRASGAGTRLLVRALNNNALLLSQAGRYEMAERLYRESLEMRTRLYGPSHLDTARAQHNLGGLLRNLGRLEESEKELLRSLDSRTDRLGEESKDVATTRSSLALTLADQGRLDEAESLLGQVVASRRADYGENHPRFVGAVVNLGFVLRLLERFDDADANFQIAEEFYVDQDRQQTPAFANVLRHRALVRVAQGRTEEAVELAGRAVEIYRATQDEGHWRVAEAESVLGKCLLELGRVDEARPLLQSSYRTLADVFGDDARRTKEAVARVAQLDAAS
ncbi:MAG: tetratricopeptide repeat protein, partial [Acidobacteriota bacterium]